MTEPVIFELGSAGRSTRYVSDSDVPERDLSELLPADALRTELNLPEVTEREAVSHFTQLSRLNYSVDGGFYPLGSCTMKYNP